MSDVAKVLEERRQTHGSFAENARLTQHLMLALRTGRNWDRLTDIQKEALHMIMHKIARLMSGDPTHHDVFVDIVGYAKLMEEANEKL